MTEVLESLEINFDSFSGSGANDIGDTTSGDGLDSVDVLFDFDVKMSEIIAVDYFDFNSKTNDGFLDSHNEDSQDLEWTVEHTIGTFIGAFGLVIILILNLEFLYKYRTRKRNEENQSTPRLSKFIHSPKRSFKIRPLPMVVHKTEIWPKCEFYGLDINNFADAVGAIHVGMDQNEMDRNGVYQNGALDKSFDSFSSGNDMFNRAFDNLPAIDQVYIQNEHLI